MKYHPSSEQLRLDNVMVALGHPIRLAVIRVLADGAEHSCGSILSGISKSTLTHHWRVLRDAGVIFQRPSGRENLLKLRTKDLEARFPGLMASVLLALAQDSFTIALTNDYLSE